MSLNAINIRPGVAMLGLFPHMKYQPWYAISELVDNAIQSFVQNQRQLATNDGPTYRLKVEINIRSADGGSIIVRDNAAGISLDDWSRAFQVAVPPSDRTGLSQFGVGMKASCCWFARRWSLRTSALGDNAIRSVDFDVPAIVASQSENLTVMSEPAPDGTHFTEIHMSALNRTPQTRTLDKIDDYLGSIYRDFIRTDAVDIFFNDRPVTYADPSVLFAPYYRTPEAEGEAWERPVDVVLASGRRVTGFVAIRATASTARAGFALLYRKKVVVGAGADDVYRPPEIFGRANSYRSQRLFGELHMDDFEVASSKDSLLFYDEEDEFLAILKRYLDDQGLLGQAEGYRARARQIVAPKPALGGTATQTEPSLQPVLLPPSLPIVVPTPPAPIINTTMNQPVDNEHNTTIPEVDTTPERVAASPVQRFVVDVDGTVWNVEFTTIDELSHQDWIAVSRDTTSEEPKVRVTVNNAQGLAGRQVGPILSQGTTETGMAIRLALAQELARQGGAQMPGLVLTNLNQLLRRTLNSTEGA